jgi:hypothetical protein
VSLVTESLPNWHVTAHFVVDPETDAPGVGSFWTVHTVRNESTGWWQHTLYHEDGRKQYFRSAVREGELQEVHR